MRTLFLTQAALLIAGSLAACTPHQSYRPVTELCVSANPAQECSRNALQKFSDQQHANESYLLGFVEFDDQGQLWSRDQMRYVVNEVNSAAGRNDLLMVVFVHGWKHNAAGPAESEAEDGNVALFRENLKRISALESALSARSGEKPRDVVGIYMGWRGASTTVAGLKELTFWNRKEVAARVGLRGATETLARLELVRQTKDAIAGVDKPPLPDGTLPRSRTRLVVVGHSFGGAVVFSAVSQILQQRFIETRGPMGSVTDARGFGSLVVLINPAFEALLYAPLSDMANERRTYFPTQRPVLLILTSEADAATRDAFPVGRWFSTMFETEREVARREPPDQAEVAISQGAANTTTVGHFAPYRTHTLKATGPANAAEDLNLSNAIARIERIRDGWRADAPGKPIDFEGSVLTRQAGTVARNPLLVVRVDGELIPNHNDIDDPRLTRFIRQMIFLAEEADSQKLPAKTPGGSR